MMFQPIIPTGGLVGWSFLNRTLEKQTAAYEASADIQRDTEYFAEKIGDITTAEQLVSDRRLLGVALGAFGLQDDIDNRYFVRKILEDGTLKADALAVRLADDRYQSFSKAFGFGDYGIPRTRLSTFAEEISELYHARSFEVAVGEQDENLRLALNATRELADLVADPGSDDTKWFRVMGNAPLRQVFETALGLPNAFGQIDLDQQLTQFRDKALTQLGDAEISQFSDPDQIARLVQRFLVRAQLEEVQTSGSGSVALTLLQSVASGASILG